MYASDHLDASPEALLAHQLALPFTKEIRRTLFRDLDLSSAVFAHPTIINSGDQRLGESGKQCSESVVECAVCLGV